MLRSSLFGRFKTRRFRPGVPSGARTMSGLEGYGEHVFMGAVARPYLEAQGLAGDTLDKPTWVTNGSKDKVASAVLSWAKDNGASVYTHWFQPMGASMVRHGLSSGAQNTMMTFLKDGAPSWDFKGSNLCSGETDGSSYVNGGLRDTHTAGGYLSIDPTSPIFLRGDTIFIPSCLVSYNGHSLDEKIPLLRACDALSTHGTRLLKLLGFQTDAVTANIGLEQEIFFIPRAEYLKRIDLQLTGRTIMGKDAPRGQKMCDHYMAPLSMASPALACIQDIQDQCMRLGIPLRTRHREVAPNQFELCPNFGSAVTQIDQNLIVMQIVEETASQYGLAALLQEKPFNNVNGSGKHNNWSISASCGTNLLNVRQLAGNSGDIGIFPIIMSAIVKAVDEHGDLLRMSIATPGNDFRLGGCEAPPSILSTYLGDDLTSYLMKYMEEPVDGAGAAYEPASKTLDMGASVLPPLVVPAEDRNRTSPFPYGGHRFEFRAVGSAQNVSIVNTVLATIVGKSFKEFADAIEGGANPKKVAQDSLKKHFKCIFNGNGYDAAEQERLTKAGVWRIDSAVEANMRYTADKNVALFKEMGVFSKEECLARQDSVLSHYTGTVEIEALCMIDMINQNVIPCVKEAGVGPLSELQDAVEILKSAVSAINATDNEAEKATLARVLRLKTMEDVRKHCDAAEAVCPARLWSLPTYHQMLFLDQTTE